MLSEKTVKTLIENGLEERSDLFLIDFKMNADNKISVVIDGDNGVTVEDCMFMSRAIEHNLDREEADFSLDVASAGATSPLVNNRQYRKNVGRTLEVKATSDLKVEGVLIDVDDTGVTLEWKTKEPKPVGKGKVVVNKQAKIMYDDILEAKVVIKF
ncbi:ribosome maturation factor RimP [Gelidibacter algens]|jgi:ribosome maturation factor RimP|uniref:Ribosome maturation factor RimP n=1 Tax=Gelidibacter algens TaxID=49280 RepID=A0A1A7R0Q6_9FLAO|nr:ribosome assembly cofactor RimP [Gelidibacter algens]OBX25103.1 ribosome assembly cofactor RimP [Gelidibacter algens]RAJ23041.1 ribosome maturation factor RimP [Gelidibacter algens]